jgi:hypothetical protein
MNGQWIIKEVYFEGGFPKIIRDLKPETPDVTPEVIPDDMGSTMAAPGKLVDYQGKEVSDHHPSITYKMLPSSYTVYKKGKRNE